MDMSNTRANTLIAVLVVVVVLSILGSALMLVSVNEANLIKRQLASAKAFHIAEAGIERAIYDLRQDFINDTGSPSWADGDINGLAIGPDTIDFYSIGYTDNSINGGTYSVQLKNVETSGSAVWVRSTGTYEDQSRTILIYAKIENFSVWDNAIFAGSGASGTIINGNVNIAGSVHILGTGLDPTDYVVDLSGAAKLIMNNYAAMPVNLKAKVPSLPTVLFAGENVKTLNAILRVKQGIVGLSGYASVGEQDRPGDSDKETVDACYVTDGFGGTAGKDNVYSDNGWVNDYDLGDTVLFPSLSDPTGSYLTYQDYFRDGALVISNPDELNVLANIDADSRFNFTDGVNTISMDGRGNLKIAGKIYIDGGGINFDDRRNTINYTGSGTVLATGDCLIDANLVTPTNNSFPDNILGIMTPGNITIGTNSQLDVMGLFYAENKIVIQKQTDLVGTIVSNYFDIGSQVPNIFQVPETVNHMPPGMIGQDGHWFMRIVSWKQTK
jgi:type II secretory pathway pseudopilin PulG